jgi:VIT1/CCC1 family predicted Fe2+/Mn2+ transporter
MAEQIAERPEPKPELLLANWQDELDSADLYRYLASREADPRRAALLAEIAGAELRHAEVIGRGLRDQGVELPRHRLAFKTRFLKLVARLAGTGVVYPLLHGLEIASTAGYADRDATTAGLAPEERGHARAVGQMSREGLSHGERGHHTRSGGILRASVFGVNDGLVSNLSLIMGFAGASAQADVVLLAGLSGLLAGSSSMAAGEYVSMKAQRELFERQLELEAAELAVTPEEERAELAQIYRAKGLNAEEAERLARRLTQDPDIALDTLAREELGLDPDDLGSPIGAAVASFLSFALGALLPVLPYLFGASTLHVLLGLLISGSALFTVGAILSLFTGRSIMFSGGRQLIIGAVAAGITFAVGKAIGVSA